VHYCPFVPRSTRAIQKLKIQNRWEGKGNHRCEGGNTVVSSILPFPFVFAFTGTPGWPEVSRRWRRDKRNYTVVCTGSGVVWHLNTKARTQAKQMPWKRWWSCWKTAKGLCWEFRSLDFVNKYFLKMLLHLYLYFLDVVLCINAPGSW
jgi:hypothetical protein